MNLRAGVLVIGSLLWEETEHRKRWRRERLICADQTRVSVPIRYGRRSNSRGDTYTMVFSLTLSMSDRTMGWGIAVPCVRKVHDTHDLVEEAEALWVAEQSRAITPGPISANWGRVGVVFNPRSPYREEVLSCWSDRVGTENNYSELPNLSGEKPAIGKDGLLRIPWPRTELGEYDGLDVLLATATDPSLVDGKYPLPDEVAKAWNIDNCGNVRYFMKNQESGIVTFEDDEIAKHLHP